MRVRLPRLLIDSVRGGIDVSAQGSTVEEVLVDLFRNPELEPPASYAGQRAREIALAAA